MTEAKINKNSNINIYANDNEFDSSLESEFIFDVNNPSELEILNNIKTFLLRTGRFSPEIIEEGMLRAIKTYKPSSLEELLSKENLLYREEDVSSAYKGQLTIKEMMEDFDEKYGDNFQDSIDPEIHWELYEPC
ncbi:hypothetical protein H1Q59_04880 [Holosporaceae bacterium 'Namur']|nr:hypothetical protein [Holosporaceae bacterium 'Namur']